MSYSYNHLDYFQMDDLLSKEDLITRDAVRSFVSQEVVPLLREANQKEEFPSQLIPQFAKLGLFGSNLHGYECPGLGEISYGLLMQELERADSGIRSFCSVQGALAMYSIYAFGSESQKNKFLPEMSKGKMIGCFGLTEPDAGSNPGGMKTQAKDAGDHYILNGNKMWITNGCISDLAIIWAFLDDKVRGFIVEKGSPGFSTTKMTGKFSLRVSVTSELHMQDCKIPKENILPDSSGLKSPLSCLTQARYGISWGVIGAANACYTEALNYAKDRIIFEGKPLAGHQLAQAKLAKMVQEITKAQLLSLRLAQLKESGHMKPHHVSLAKMNNCRMALDIAREARDMLGANGIIDEYPVIRHMMNLETVNTYEGTEDIHRLVVGQSVTGIPAYR